MNNCRNEAFYGLKAWLGVLRDGLDGTAVDECLRVSTGTPLVKAIEGSLGPCFNIVQMISDPAVWQWVAKSGVRILSPYCMI
jgi:hypothetical protein